MTALHMGHAIDWLHTIPDASIDMVLTDPPYGVTRMDYDRDVHATVEAVLKILLDKLKTDGWFFMFGTVEMCMDAMDLSWKRKFEYVWIKPSGIIAHRNVIRPMSQHEMIYAFIHPKARNMKGLYFDRQALQTKGDPYTKHQNMAMTGDFQINLDNKRREGFRRDSITRNTGTREGTSVLAYPSKLWMKMGERTDHPSQKPLELGRYLVRGYCRPGGTVMDPFAGSGTFLLAAALEGRKYEGCEIFKKYHTIAEARLKEYVPAITNWGFQV